MSKIFGLCDYVFNLIIFTSSKCELWCGENNGNISIFTMNENSVVGHDVINHFESPLPNVEVLQMISSHSPHYYESRHAAVWSYIYPGEFHWIIGAGSDEDVYSVNKKEGKKPKIERHSFSKERENARKSCKKKCEIFKRDRIIFKVK